MSNAIKFVQSTSTTTSGAGATLAKAYTSNITSTNACFAVCYWGSATATCTITDNNAGNWIPVGAIQVGTGGLAAFSSQMFYAPSHPSGATTVTMTVSDASVTSKGIAILEYSGISSSGALESSGYKNQNGTSVTTATLLTSVANCLVIAYDISSNSVSSVTTFTMRELANFGSNGVADNILTATASSTATFTVLSSDNMLGIMAFDNHAVNNNYQFVKVGDGMSSSEKIR